MVTNERFQAVRKSIIAVLAMGMLWGTSCGSGLDALVVGVEAASRELDRRNRFDDIDNILGDLAVDVIREL